MILILQKEDNSFAQYPDDYKIVQYPDGYKIWYINGNFHREAGPAIEHDNGDKYWYLNGIRIYCSDNEEFLRLIKVRAFW